MRFELFKDRNFAAACLFMVMIGVSLFGTMALITPFTQNLLGYPIMTAGFVLGSRGVGTLIAMMAVGRLLKFVEARTLVFCGLALTAVDALPHGRLHHRHIACRPSSSPASSRAPASASCSCRSPRSRSRRCPASCATAARRC